MNWVLAATLICGASVLTSCSSNDNPLTPDLNLSEMIIGKWILAETNGKPTPTNQKYVITFVSPNKGYLSASLNSYAEISSFWGDRQEVDVAISGNMLKNTMVINEHLTVVDDIKVTSITDTDTWGDLKVSWIADGTLLATRWKNQGDDMAYEWWEISTVSGGQMQWDTLRQNTDGSTFQQSVKWTKVE